MENNFKPYQKVLVRYNEKQDWDIAFYQRPIPGQAHRVIGMQFPVPYVIPYEGNEHLLGTSNSPDMPHEIKWGDKFMVLQGDLWREAIYLGQNYESSNGYLFIFKGDDQAKFLPFIPKLRPLPEDK